jgi:excisionase family DNA binding protein
MDGGSLTMTSPDMTILVKMMAIEITGMLKAELAKLASPGVQPALLTVKQAALYIGRSEQAVQHLIFQKELPVVRNGRRVHLDRRDLDGWIENNKIF